MEKLRNIFKISVVYMGLIIGAGFASGKEIACFFVSYGKEWVYGMFLASLLFAITGYSTLNCIYKNKITTYSNFMEFIAGSFLGRIMDCISGVFLCVLFFTMAAAAGALGKQTLGMNYFAGVFLLLGLCFLVFLKGVKGVIFVNSILSPIMLCGGILIALYTYFTLDTNVFLNILYFKKNIMWFISAIIYVSYNIITAVPILISLHDIVTSKSIAFLAPVLSSLFMGILGVCIGAVLFVDFEEIKSLEIPMLFIIDKYGGMVKMVYIAVIICAVFTTAVGNGFGALNWIGEKTGLNKIKVNIFLFIIAAVFSTAGFSVFVGNFYYIFGILGLGEMVFIFAALFINNKN